MNTALTATSAFPLTPELLLESSPDCVRVLDLHGNLLSMNRNGLGLMEIDDLSQVCGLPWASLWPDESSQQIQSALEQARQGKLGHFTAFCPTAKGMPKFWDVRVTPVHGSDGQLQGFLSASRDITVLQELLHELRAEKSEQERRLKTTEALLASNRDLQQFAAITAHDLRAPVLSMTGFLSMLQRRHGEQLDESGRNLVMRANRAANHMGELIEGMLSLARLDSPGLKMQEFDAQKAARDAVNQIESDIAMADAHVEIAKLPNIHAHRVQFVQLLQNLIGNAVQYRDQSRQVQIRVSAEEEEEHWLFRVEDNGIGIEREHHGRIFEIFQRLHGQEQYPGNGIGLAICQRIALRHGGKVWVNSEPGQGSTFLFLISKTPLIEQGCPTVIH